MRAVIYEAIKNTIATEKDLEILRFTVVTLLGEAGTRIERLAKLDPIADPVFRQETADAIRSRLGATHDVEMMRAFARDLFMDLTTIPTDRNDIYVFDSSGFPTSASSHTMAPILTVSRFLTRQLLAKA